MTRHYFPPWGLEPRAWYNLDEHSGQAITEQLRTRHSAGQVGSPRLIPLEGPEVGNCLAFKARTQWPPTRPGLKWVRPCLQTVCSRRQVDAGTGRLTKIIPLDFRLPPCQSGQRQEIWRVHVCVTVCKGTCTTVGRHVPTIPALRSQGQEELSLGSVWAAYSN